MGSRRSPRDYNIPVTIRESLKSPQPETDARPVRLMREVRFSIDRDWVRAARGESGFEKALPVTNSWGGWPSAVGVAPFLVLRIIVSGTPDPVTGYLVNIQELDRLLRRHAIPVAAQRLSTSGVGLAGESLLAAIFERVRTRVPDRCRLETLSLLVTPYLSYAINERDSTMVELTQCFEFSASHRLHVPDLSDEENLGTFGKCNNPNGHGHNYQVEITVAGPIPETTGRVLPLPQFEAAVKREVIDRFDHKHLNTDTAEFARVNPSVENIAHVIWRLLQASVAPAKLRRVRVWETAKTYAEYGGD
jgi:6-pyruvoyltetrahydropterin/6-carboxytetrahydropterin synthase